MSPARTRRRHHRSPLLLDNNLQNVQVSDADIEVDSDPQNVQSLANEPLIASRTNEELNLSVLQRYNPSITRILAIAPYAVLYAFSSSAQTWEKTGTEGTLFVCQLRSEEDLSEEVLRYLVLILNRRGLENFEVELTREEEIEITEQFIIVRASNQGHRSEADGSQYLKDYSLFYGLWIFADPYPSSTAGMKEFIAKVIQNCASQAEASRKWSVQKNAYTSISAENYRPSFPVEGMSAMTRQLSLRELIAQQNSTLIHTIPESSATPSRDILTDLFRNAKIRQQMDASKPG